MAVVLGLIASIAIGMSDLFGRRMVAATTPLAAATTIQSISVVPAALFAIIMASPFESGPVTWGALSGVGMAAGLYFYYSGLQRSTATVMAPLVAVLTAIIPFTWAAIRGGQVTATAWAGSGLALVGLVLVTSGAISAERMKAGVAWGLASGASYGLASAVFVQAADGTGWWPGASQRIGSAVALALAALAVHQPVLAQPNQWPNGLGAGAAGSIASLTMLGGLFLAEVPTIVALSTFPAFSVIVGRIFFADPVTARQALGIVASIVGVVAVALA